MSLKQIAFLSLLSVAILCGVYFASTSLASPTCQSGTNCAAINVEPNTWNVTIGSSTVTSSARLYLVPMASTHTAITADGIIKVRVGGITYPDGNTQTVAFTGSGMTPAANISQGAFTNGGAGGNFAFQSGLAIGTTNYATLPQTLSVYGGGYFSGNVGIRVTSPSGKLEIGGTEAADEPRLIFAASDASDRFTIKTDLDAITSNDFLGFRSVGVDNILVLKGNGNVGIGTTTPAYKLDVVGQINSSGGLCIAGDCKTAWSQVGGSQWTTTSTGIYYNSGNVGIGTTNSYDRLHVYGGGLRISNGAFGANGFVFEQNGATGHLNIRYKNPTSTSAEVMTLGYDGKVGIGTTTPTAVLEIQKAATANLFKVGDGTNYMTWYGNGYNDINSYGAALRLYASTNGIQFRTGGADPAVVILNGGNVGIGVSGPTYKLDVVSGGGTTARFGTASSDTVTVGNGAGKINVGTVDPIYTINGKKYATYGPESIGIKISHSDLIKLIRNGKYSEAKLDFKNAKEGSDLWLFSKTTNLIKNFNKLSIQLTPSFIGKVWYSKDKENMAVKIYAIPDLEENNDLEVTYTLTAPRFDADSWGNYSNDDVDGFIIND